MVTDATEGVAFSRVTVMAVPVKVFPALSVAVACTANVPSLSDAHVGKVVLLVHVAAVLPVVALCVVARLAAPDYPRRSDYAGATIAGLEAAEAAGALVFHGGTAARDGRVITNGGRILSVTATADSVGVARERAYEAVDLVSFEGVCFRRDIAAAARG